MSAKHLLVIHEVLLPETAGHQQHVYLGHLRDTHFRSKDQPLHVSNWIFLVFAITWTVESGMRDRTSKGPVKSIWSIRGKIIAMGNLAGLSFLARLRKKSGDVCSPSLLGTPCWSNQEEFR
jgi:hypothetical protein